MGETKQTVDPVEPVHTPRSGPRCSTCGESLRGKRADARYCSDGCRSRGARSSKPLLESSADRFARVEQLLAQLRSDVLLLMELRGRVTRLEINGAEVSLQGERLAALKAAVDRLFQQLVTVTDRSRSQGLKLQKACDGLEALSQASEAASGADRSFGRLEAKVEELVQRAGSLEAFRAEVPERVDEVVKRLKCVDRKVQVLQDEVDGGQRNEGELGRRIRRLESEFVRLVETLSSGMD